MAKYLNTIVWNDLGSGWTTESVYVSYELKSLVLLGK
jgi:hypothetical protein